MEVDNASLNLCGYCDAGILNPHCENRQCTWLICMNRACRKTCLPKTLDEGAQ